VKITAIRLDRMRLPDRPGLGAQIDPAAVTRYAR